MTPLDHDNATATVSITGLALGCYNKATENYEVGFLRHECHALTIEVKKKLPFGDDSIMMYEIKDFQHRIFIDAENAVSPEDPIYTVGGKNFPRKELRGDLEDFGWVIDFDRDFNNGNQVKLERPSNIHLTEMYISKPRLYSDTTLLTKEPYVRIPLGDDGKPLFTEAEDFGFFTEGVKADITCQDGGAVIFRIDGPQGVQVHLPHADGPHEIIIKHLCHPKLASEDENTRDDSDTDDTMADLKGDDTGDDSDANDNSSKPERTDFSIYYSLMKDINGKKFDIQPSGHGEGAVCNVVTFGGGRASLYPVPTSDA